MGTMITGTENILAVSRLVCKHRMELELLGIRFSQPTFPSIRRQLNLPPRHSRYATYVEFCTRHALEMRIAKTKTERGTDMFVRVGP